MKISDDEYYDIKQNLINALAPQLGIEPEKELRKTEIKDKNGTIHDLEKLVKKECVIDTGTDIYMSLWSKRDCGYVWISSNTSTWLSKDLAYHLHPDHMTKDSDQEITVHEFRNMAQMRDQNCNSTDTELSDAQFYYLTRSLLASIAPKLGIKLEEDLEWDQVKDKDGNVRSIFLFEKKQCIVDTGEHIFMPVFDARENDKYWITPNGFTCSTRDLAQRIRIDEFVENPNLNVTIHKFRDMRTQRTVFYL
jgi:hypothetical protein